MTKLQERDVLIEPWFSVNLNGYEMGEDMLKYVSAIEVTDEVEKYSEALIEVQDIDNMWAKGAWIKNKVPVVIRMGHTKNNMSVFRGKISVIEASYPREGVPMLTIKAIDTGIEMMRERFSKIYRNMTVSQVVELMHRTAGLDIEVEDSKTVMSSIAQTKETYAEFTHRWKKQLGWRYFKRPVGGYYFGSKPLESFQVETLGYRVGGLEIISFTPTYVDAETEEEEDETEVDSKDAEPKKSVNQFNLDYAKVPSGGARIVKRA